MIRSALLPLVVAAQTVPIVAIAPAVVLFMGTGTASKTVVAGFLTFFPMAVTTARGLQSVPVDSVNLLRTYNASTLSVLGGVKLPFALPLIFVGLETSAAFSVVGAIVAELEGRVAGLTAAKQAGVLTAEQAASRRAAVLQRLAGDFFRLPTQWQREYRPLLALLYRRTRVG